MTFKMKQSLIAVSSVLAMGTASADIQVAAEQAVDSVVIVYKQGVDAKQRTQVVRQLTGNAITIQSQHINTQGVDSRFAELLDGRITSVKLPAGVDLKTAIKELKKNPNIAMVEPNIKVRAFDTVPNDPDYGSLYGMEKIQAPAAWDVTQGSDEIVVAVIDTGVDYNHPDLIDNHWVNPNEIPGNGIDDDNNGVIDDVYGFSGLNNDGDPMDTNGHGTHVAGTIGATGNNGVGVVGVNWNTKIMGCSFLGSDGSGTLDGGLACLNYILDMKRNHGVNVRVANASFGWDAEFIQLWEDVLNEFDQEDILFVAAAGNAGRDNDNAPAYPANFNTPSLMSIASTTSSDSMSGFSSYGVETVHMGAPGSDILSTIPNGGYASYSGTSMATPHVAGAAALVLSERPELSAVELKEILMQSGDSIAALEGNTISGKRLNVKNALTYVPTPFSVSLSESQATVVQGEVVEVTLAVTADNWEGVLDVALDAPEGINATLSANTVAANGTVTLTINTAEITNYSPISFGLNLVAQENAQFTASQNFTLNVIPQGTEEVLFENNEPASIPDYNADGVTSTITVDDQITVYGAQVNVDVSHTWRGDLIIGLISPAGTVYMLTDQEGGDADDYVATLDTNIFNGEIATGDWRLRLFDIGQGDVGQLNNWSLKLTGIVSNLKTQVAKTKYNNDTKLGKVVLTWDNAEGRKVEIHQNGELLKKTKNDGRAGVKIQNAEGTSHTFKICEIGGDVCSNTVNVNFNYGSRYTTLFSINFGEDSEVTNLNNGETVILFSSEQ